MKDLPTQIAELGRRYAAAKEAKVNTDFLHRRMIALVVKQLRAEMRQERLERKQQRA